MKYKNYQLLNSFIKIAKDKQLIKEEVPKILDLKISNNLMDNMLKLSNGLREKDLDSYADELESNYLLYASANTYETKGAKDLVDEAHPQGSLEYKDVDGEAIFHTVLDTQLKMLEVLSKTPKIKNAKLINEVRKVFGQLNENFNDNSYDKKTFTNVVDNLLQGGAGKMIKDLSQTSGQQKLTPEEQEILKKRQLSANKPGQQVPARPAPSALIDKLVNDYDAAITRISRFKAIIKAHEMPNSKELNAFLDKVDLFLKNNKKEYLENEFKADEKVRDPYVKKLNDANVRLNAFETRWLQ